eukprot:771245-Pyramimonas_sp.AAC.1
MTAFDEVEASMEKLRTEVGAHESNLKGTQAQVAKHADQVAEQARQLAEQTPALERLEAAAKDTHKEV